MLTEELLLSHIRIEPNGCWIWERAKNDVGYGQSSLNGEVIYTHRWAYEHWKEPIPDKYEVDHLCRNHLCCNPAHLEAVTHEENMRRGAAPNWITNRTGICKRGHILENDNRHVRKDGRARCRECEKQKAREKYERLHGGLKRTVKRVAKKYNTGYN